MKWLALHVLICAQERRRWWSVWGIGKPSQGDKLGLFPGSLCSDKQTALSCSQIETDICICQGLVLLNIQVMFIYYAGCGSALNRDFHIFKSKSDYDVTVNASLGTQGTGAEYYLFVFTLLGSNCHGVNS